MALLRAQGTQTNLPQQQQKGGVSGSGCGKWS
eukprot:CAMPEP_0115758176 /NCGR_PEP_ID=MMETSP0272-20121206/98802_1 /TAXON_ID=71861 /ORGANISM="Scrippsiella trochoidea, Strain CCMP3099" /LENGTH=31 /DNA_ID= /DNA_START= /DNA_END= /DNA_ORIENTATION=